MVDEAIPQERCDFYVYVIFRRNGEPCYVGKGQRARWLAHARGSHNKRLRGIFTKEGRDLPVVKVREDLTNVEACAVEIALIRAIGRQDIGTGPLVNFTDGGEGLLGHIPTPETRAKKSVALKGRKRPSEIGEAVRRAAAWTRPEWRGKQRESHLGKEVSDAQRLNQCIAHLQRLGRRLEDIGSDGVKLTSFQRKLLGKPPMTKDEMGTIVRKRNIGNKYGIGNKRTKEGQDRVTAAVSEANRRRVATPEYRAKRSAIAKAIWASRSAEEKAEWHRKVTVAIK